MHNSFDYQIESGQPVFRIPQRFGWIFYAYWLAFIVCLGAVFYCQIQTLKSGERLAISTAARDAVVRQDEDVQSQLSSLNQSNRLKNQWLQIASQRTNHAKLLSKVLEAAGPNLLLEKITIAQSNTTNSEESMNLFLNVVNQPEDKATQTISDFRNAFRNFDSYTLKSNTDNSSGRAGSSRSRGSLVTEYHVQESWVFHLQPFTEAELFRRYQQLNIDFPVTPAGAKGAK